LTFHKVGDEKILPPPGGMVTVTVDWSEVVIANVDGEYHAIQGVCEHAGGPLGAGYLVGCQLTCPLHGAEFCLRTGEVLTPPAYEPLDELAFAREAGIEFTLDDIEAISRRTPVIADMRPTGRYVALDMYRAGGLRLLAQRLIDGGLIDGSTPTVTGRTLGEEAAEAQETPGQDGIVTLEAPLKESGGLTVLRGNLAPDGAAVKLKGIEPLRHRGPARVFDSEEDAFVAIEKYLLVKQGIFPSARRRGPLGYEPDPETLAEVDRLVTRLREAVDG